MSVPDARLPWERLLVAMLAAFLAGVVFASCGRIVEPTPCTSLVRDSVAFVSPAGDTGGFFIAINCAEGA